MFYFLINSDPLLLQASTLACRVESDSIPSQNVDRPDICTGKTNKCAFGPVEVPFKDGASISYTFCNKAGRDIFKRELLAAKKGNHQ